MKKIILGMLVSLPVFAISEVPVKVTATGATCYQTTTQAAEGAVRGLELKAEKICGKAVLLDSFHAKALSHLGLCGGIKVTAVFRCPVSE